MIEQVGTCTKCNKTIYCENGFFTGIIQTDGKIICFACDDSLEKK